MSHSRLLTQRASSALETITIRRKKASGSKKITNKLDRQYHVLQGLQLLLYPETRSLIAAEVGKHYYYGLAYHSTF